MRIIKKFFNNEHRNLLEIKFGLDYLEVVNENTILYRGKKLNVKRAEEPNDIIWENYYKTQDEINESITKSNKEYFKFTA